MKHKGNHIDASTLFAVVTLMVLGLGVVYSASASWIVEKGGSSERFLASHAMKVMLGFVMILFFMKIDYKKYRKLTKFALIGAIVLLGVTFALGGELKGATRWLSIAGFSFQPSDFARYALIFHLCTMIAQKGETIKDLKKGFVPMLIWVGTVTAFVFAQPNFSTGAMIMLISAVMMFVGRAQLKHMILTVAAVLPLVIGYLLWAPYRVKRVTDFFASVVGISATGNAVTAEMPHQLKQGIIGFANGGVFGVGIGLSKQRDLYLPESYGDFVFSIVGEEYGLIGTLVFMALFVLILIRGMKIARHAPDEYGRYLAVGIVSSIALYALVNAGVTLGLLPTTGLPMPFVSYGGSSMIFSSIAIGVLLNISSQTDLHPRVARTVEAGYEATIR